MIGQKLRVEIQHRERREVEVNEHIQDIYRNVGDLASRLRKIEEYLSQAGSQPGGALGHPPLDGPPRQTPKAGPPPAAEENVKTLEEVRPEVEADSAEEPIEAANSSTEKPLDTNMLDRGDMYNFNESIWDAQLFTGLTFVGSLTSLVLVVTLLMNIGLQLIFLLIAYSQMTDPLLTTETLVDLLHFRAGVAHSVQWADTVNRRSMLTQVCRTEDNIHISSGQTQMYNDLSAFSNFGLELSVMVQFCWLLFVMGEFSSTFHFTRALLSAKRGRTRFVTDGVEDDNSDNVESMVLITVVTRLKELSFCRIVCVFIFVVVPRIFLTAMLYYVGVLFLLSAPSHSDLILNSMALTFILDLDENFYTVFVPRRVKTVVNNLEGLPVRPSRFAYKTRIAGINACTLLVLMSGIMFAVYWLYVGPLFGLISEAQIVLCGGVTNFVYAKEPLTYNVHAVRTDEAPKASFMSDKCKESDWWSAEIDVLSLAQPPLNKENWPSLPECVFNATATTVIDSFIHPYFRGTMQDFDDQVKAGSLDTPDLHWFSFIRSLDVASPMDVAENMDCDDLVNAPTTDVAIQRLRQVTGVDVYDAGWDTCNQTVDFCQQIGYDAVRALCPWTCGCAATMQDNSKAGFFGATAFGCPRKCETLLGVTSHFSYLYLPPAMAMPCEDLAPQFWEMGPEPIVHYFTGLFDYTLQGDTEAYASYLTVVIGALSGVLNLPQYGVSVAQYVEGFMNGTVMTEFISFQWTIGFGILHPRGLTGCQFLTSYELKAIFGINLCDVGKYRSLRFPCPQSCGCLEMNNTGRECPSACDLGESNAGAEFNPDFQMPG